MPSRVFDVTRAQAEEEPIRFRFIGEWFECRPSPTLGDTFDLIDAPEPDVDNFAQAAYAIAKFVRRLLVDEDARLRWDDVLRSTGMEALPALVDLGSWLVEQVTGHPSEPPNDSSGGRRQNGQTSRRSRAGRRPSKV